MKAKLHLVFSITIIFTGFSIHGQQGYWKSVPKEAGLKSASVHNASKAKAAYFLDKAMFAKELQQLSVSKERRIVAHLPIGTDKMLAFDLKETAVLNPELAQKYPQIKSYTGSSLNGEYKLKLSSSHKGLQGMIVNKRDGKTFFMEKVSNRSDTYLLYEKGSGASAKEDFLCETAKLQASVSKTIVPLVDDQLLRRYRIAVSASGEYTQFHGGTVADALAAINATLTRVNEVFETDLGVTLELVPNNDLVIFTDPNTDPYTSNLNSQVQNTLTTNIGEANYDVGHLFHKVDEGEDNGNAGFIGAVCSDNQKGSAFSSAFNPQGDVFDLDYVSHELGHQFGANHTWSFESEGTGVQAEPASGTTIMGYAGIVPGNNVAPNGDDYFHYYSILQISEYLQTISCAQTVALTNAPPVVTPMGDYIIPKGTAFVLEGEANDPDIGDILTYTWEQIDNGVVTTGTFGPNNPSSANFRSLPPSTDPVRYFPRLSEVVQGNLTQTDPLINEAWETVSNVERDLSFALTVRDNAAGGGQVISDVLGVRVINAAGPFVVTSQASSEVYGAGTIQEVTWDVANTNQLPISAETVDIFLSTDGGASFPILLADDTLNDGMEDILIPGNVTSNARIMVKASDNVFFSVSASNFSIQQSDVVLAFQNLDHEVCQPNDLIIPFTYQTFGGFSETSTFSADVPVGLTASFNPVNATGNDTAVDLTLSNTNNVAPGVYDITVTSTSASVTKEVVLSVAIRDAGFTDVVLLSPVDAAANVSLNAQLSWEANPLYSSYDVEVATDVGFSSIVASATVPFNFYLASDLLEQTDYFWRARPNNGCGSGVFGTPFSFSTTQLDCQSFDKSTDLPLEIPSAGTPTVSTSIQIFEDLVISDVNVNIDLSHTFLEDLVITLISPAGTRVALVANTCGDLNNINAIFDDDGSPISCSGNPAISGTVGPLGSLASLQGESVLGEWILEIRDTAPSDGGFLNGFSLEVCAEGAFRPDEDEDGVFDDGDDLCLGTPKGTEVDVTGCPVNRFPADNFTVEIQSEACRSNNDGSISVTASDSSITYSGVLTGVGTSLNADFTSTHTFQNVGAGSYTLCINGTNGATTFQETCFEVVVSQPEVLSVAAVVDAGLLELTLQGGNFYNVELNGLVTQTEESKITIPLAEGRNSLKVYTNLPCQGTFEESFLFTSRPILYPNPVFASGTIFLNGYSGPVGIEVFSMIGRLSMSDTVQVNGNQLELDFSALASGTYVLRVKTNNATEVFKLIKR
ncbi:reprolysin-like metallopeptidase [Flagellimonas meishanensis]|uniref:reprolysin-like metallopeptidase n=1 Tax=Flagellimonas meishanensis TaxID=2873264 RepID=UPI001CA668E4|nr:zinc-dependent metalloprotease family protein [[Muricauda] meishanensis]